MPIALLRAGCAAALLSAAAAWADDGPRLARGPLGLRTQGTLRELFLDPIGADARPDPRVWVEVRWAGANVWNEAMLVGRAGDPRLTVVSLDEQADSLTASVRVPWAAALAFVAPGERTAGTAWERLATTVEWRLTQHWGGWSDPWIEAWHSLSGAFNYGREGHLHNQIRLALLDDGGARAFDLSQPVLAPGDLVVRTQALLAQGGAALSCASGLRALDPRGPCPGRPRWALAARLDLKLPTGALWRAGGSGGFDAALVGLATVELADWLTLHGMVSASRLSPFSAPVRLQPHRYQASAELSLEAELGEWELLFEDRISSELMEDGWSRVPFGDDNTLLASGLSATFRHHNQLSFGVRFREWTAWFSEDFTPGPNPNSFIHFLYVSNSPDAVLGLSWRRAF